MKSYITLYLKMSIIWLIWIRHLSISSNWNAGQWTAQLLWMFIAFGPVMDALTASLEWEALLAACITIHREITAAAGEDQDRDEFKLAHMSVWLCNANRKFCLILYDNKHQIRENHQVIVFTWQVGLWSSCII